MWCVCLISVVSWILGQADLTFLYTNAATCLFCPLISIEVSTVSSSCQVRLFVPAISICNATSVALSSHVEPTLPRYTSAMPRKETHIGARTTTEEKGALNSGPLST